MGAGKRFQRIFLIFSNEDLGFEAVRKPSGHVVIEVRDGKGKLQSTVQSLRPGNGKYEYVLYLVGNIRGETVPVKVGQYKMSAGKANLEWGFDPGNVGLSGHEIDDFEIAAVIADHVDNRRGSVICPLAAYKGKKQEWRMGFQAAISVKIKLEETSDGYGEAVAPQPNKMGHEGIEAEQYEDKKGYEGAVEQGQYKQEYGEAVAPHPNKMGHEGIEAEQYEDKKGYEEAVEQGQYKSEYGEAVAPEQKEEKPAYGKDTTPNQDYKNELGMINTDCVYLNGNICGAFVNKNVNGAKQCDECKIGMPRNTMASTAVRINRLREELSRYFEKCDPFHSRRSDYIWWNVNNPVNLNNILYESSIRSPLLFNPAVMLAHYKYKHLIIGIFQHKETEKQYVVCGVPCMYMVDQKPFGEMSRWAQAEGSRIRYGAFGYWLVYINPEDGKMLSLN